MTSAQEKPPTEDIGRRKRRQAIYVLTGFCAMFFIGGIIISYVVAAHYGYGSGFGDGFTKPAPHPHGSGFFGDIAIFTTNVAIDCGILFFWHWLCSRLDAPSEDDPVATGAGDPALDESWYYVHIPRLTGSLVGIASFCIVGVVVLVASILPVVLTRYGWN